MDKRVFSVYGKKYLKHILRYIKTFCKWGALSVFTGIVCGGIGTLFHILLEYVTELRVGNPWLLYLLPAAGVCIVLVYRLWGVEEDMGTNLVISSIRSSEKIPINMAPLIFIGTLLTHLCGGSAGREGAALQIGGSIGAFLGRTFRLGDRDIKILTMCGMSAVFAALFGTPVTATIFSMEVISVGVMYYAAFLPCIVAALIAVGIAGAFGIEPTAFTLTQIPEATVMLYIKVVILAALCAVCSILFIVSMHAVGHLYRKLLKNQYIRAAAGGIIVVLLSVLLGTGDYNGAGMDVIVRAIGGEAVPWAFLLKILMTALTLGAGFKGGEIVPSFFVGATFGCTVGAFMGLDPGFAAAVGLICLFCSVVNCPVTSLILSVELFGPEVLAIMAPACAVSYLLSGYYGLYSSQKIVYSKLKSEFVNRKAQ